MIMEEAKNVIEINNLTKDYGNGRGNFNINLTIKEGETIGLVGENGAGKTTLMRLIMGFVRPNEGNIKVYGLDAIKDASEIKRYIGYIPGEIAFPDVKTGTEFLHQYAEKLSLKEDCVKRADEVIRRMQLDITAYPRRMSKGMKQKTSIVAALMRESPIYLFDEPTTGLDPLMRDEFLALVKEEKDAGRTILMSSNTIDELEKVADRVIFLSKGKIIDMVETKTIKERKFRDYKIEFVNKRDYELFLKDYEEKAIRRKDDHSQMTVRLFDSEVNKMLLDLRGKHLKFLAEMPYTLQDHFDENRKGDR